MDMEFAFNICCSAVQWNPRQMDLNSAICLWMQRRVLEWDVNKVWQVLAGYPCYPVEIGGIGRGGKWTFIAREKPTSKHQQLNPFGQNMLLLGAHIQHSSHGGFFIRMANNWPWAVCDNIGNDKLDSATQSH